MKLISLAAMAALSLTSTGAHAGGLAPTVEAHVVILQEPSTESAANIIVPLLLLGLIAAASGAAGTNDDGDGGDEFSFIDSAS